MLPATRLRGGGHLEKTVTWRICRESERRWRCTTLVRELQGVHQVPDPLEELEWSPNPCRTWHKEHMPCAMSFRIFRISRRLIIGYLKGHLPIVQHVTSMTKQESLQFAPSFSLGDHPCEEEDIFHFELEDNHQLILIGNLFFSGMVPLYSRDLTRIFGIDTAIISFDSRSQNNKQTISHASHTITILLARSPGPILFTGYLTDLSSDSQPLNDNATLNLLETFQVGDILVLSSPSNRPGSPNRVSLTGPNS